MARLRIKLELNPGGDGIRLDKLANISTELEQFLRSLAKDCGVSSAPGDWVARNFYNSSVGAVLEHSRIVEPAAAVKFNTGIKKLTSFRADRDRLNGAFSEATVRNFVSIGSKLDTDEVVKIGVLNSDLEEVSEETEPEVWANVAKRKTIEIEDALLREIEYVGSVQGRLATWHRDADPPFVHLREGVTGNLVRCNYRTEAYDQIYRAYKDRKAIVHLTGRIKSDRLNGHPREVWIETIQVFERLDDKEFFSLSGSVPDFTGRQTAADYLDRMREDD